MNRRRANDAHCFKSSADFKVCKFERDCVWACGVKVLRVVDLSRIAPSRSSFASFLSLAQTVPGCTHHVFVSGLVGEQLPDGRDVASVVPVDRRERREWLPAVCALQLLHARGDGLCLAREDELLLLEQLVGEDELRLELFQRLDAQVVARWREVRTTRRTRTLGTLHTWKAASLSMKLRRRGEASVLEVLMRWTDVVAVAVEVCAAAGVRGGLGADASLHCRQLTGGGGPRLWQRPAVVSRLVRVRWERLVRQAVRKRLPDAA
mmetsp:Transcript_26158/g.57311  ORF Transcript_26158/g.57311 Transcript_26158/m.57311 type:complete len:264 (+) Transcript_26158:393-1184(+)|eukprot:5899445-Pleurochrysis_carterae.AAC.3